MPSCAVTSVFLSFVLIFGFYSNTTNTTIMQRVELATWPGEWRPSSTSLQFSPRDSPPHYLSRWSKEQEGFSLDWQSTIWRRMPWGNILIEVFKWWISCQREDGGNISVLQDTGSKPARFLNSLGSVPMFPWHPLLGKKDIPLFDQLI